MPVTVRAFPLRLVGLALAVPLAACQADRGASPIGVDLRVAKGGVKGGPGGGEDSGIEVTATDPDTAPQGAALEIRVLGSGFEDGVEVSFELDGKPANDITVHSTEFVDGGELRADVAVAPDARVTKYDVVVQARGGKKGIGLELFEVKYNGPPFEDPLAVEVVDGFDLADDGDDYVDRTDEVSALLFGTGNLGLDVRGEKKGRFKADRRILATLRDPTTGAVVHQAALDANVTTSNPDVEGGLRALEPGQSMTTDMRLLWGADDGTTQWLRYGSKCESGGPADPGGRALVTRTLAGWTIEAENGYWCLGGDPATIVPHPDAPPEGRVRATLRLTARRLFP